VSDSEDGEQVSGCTYIYKSDLKRFFEDVIFEDALEPRSPQVRMTTVHRCRNSRYSSSVVVQSLRQERIHPADAGILFMPRVKLVHGRWAFSNPLRLALS
jgi:hypothetical protein